MIRKILLVMSIVALGAMTSLQAQNLPKVTIIATGGTIAGSGTSKIQTNYTAGVVTIDKLINAVPEVMKLAEIKGVQISSIGSQDMNDVVWLKLAKKINKLFASDDCDGVVITHGTDTMEETAYFLSLVIKSKKPVILVGSMRPGSAMSADGPMNLYNAVALAANKDAVGRGVMVSMNDLILGADDVTKSNTTNVATFVCPNWGPLGYMHNGIPTFRRETSVKHTYKSEFDIMKLKKLPKVDIIYSYSNVNSVIVDALVKDGAKGLVHAGVGNGNIYKTVFPKLIKAQKRGVQVVRSSRVYSGSTTLDAEVDDAKFNFVASLYKNPQKSRILLMLALTKTNDYKEIQRMFYEY
ncbi:MAG: L-asparaginase 2 [Marinifilaceae bacterium]